MKVMNQDAKPHMHQLVSLPAIVLKVSMGLTIVTYSRLVNKYWSKFVGFNAIVIIAVNNYLNCSMIKLALLNCPSLPSI